MSWSRIIGLIPKIGDKNIGMIENLSKEHNCTVLDICKDIAKYSTKKAVIDGATKFYNIYDHKIFKNPGNSLAYLLEKFDYKKHLDMTEKNAETLQSRKDNIDEFLTFCTEQGNNGQNLSNFLINLSLVKNKEGENTNKVVLQSVHAAKGLEYKVVMACGMEKSILPCYFSYADVKDEKTLIENIEEERRCCFVMFTRAQKHLHISYCENRKRRDNKTGKSVIFKTFPSQFLYEAGLIKIEPNINSFVKIK